MVTLSSSGAGGFNSTSCTLNSGSCSVAYTPTAVGTELAEGRETRVINGREYLLEYALPLDYAFVRATRADTFGNLIYRKTARNFNPMMAAAAAFVIAEVEHIVEVGEIDGDAVHTPGSYVDRLARAVPALSSASTPSGRSRPASR